MRGFRPFAILLAGLFAGRLLCEPPPPGVPEAGPEQLRFRYFPGTWHYRLEMKPGPFGPGGFVEGTDSDELFPGGFFLVRHYRTKGPAGPITGLEVLQWDARAGAYFQRGFDSRGEARVSRGTVDGNTWTWTCDARAGGKSYKVRITIQERSPRRQAYLSEISEDGKTWTTTLQGTLIRKESSDVPPREP